MEEPQETILPGISEDTNSYSENSQQFGNNYNSFSNSNNFNNSQRVNNEEEYRPVNYAQNSIVREAPKINREVQTETIDLTNLLTPGKKIVTFVGTGKNGTSFYCKQFGRIIINIWS